MNKWVWFVVSEFIYWYFSSVITFICGCCFVFSVILSLYIFYNPEITHHWMIVQSSLDCISYLVTVTKMHYIFIYLVWWFILFPFISFCIICFVLGFAVEMILTCLFNVRY
jgi:hypothetical protein